MKLFAISALTVLSIALGDVRAAFADAAAFKIGYVDMQSALEQIDEGKKEKAKLKKDFDGKQKKLDQMQDDLKKMKEDFDKQAPMMKEDAKAKKQQEMQTKFMELQKVYVDLQKELQEKQNIVTREIFSKMKGIIEKIGDRDNYTLIMERNEANVLYFKKHMDITDEVVRIYNSQFKVNLITPPIRLSDLARQTGAELRGDPNLVIEALMPLEWAGPGQLSFYANPKYLEAAKTCRASALITAAPIEGGPANLLVHPDPYLTAAKVAVIFHPPARRAPQVHPTAFVAPDARLGKNVFVGPCAVVEAEAEIGDDVQLYAQTYVGLNASIGAGSILYPGVKIMNGCQLGERCILQPGVVIGGDGFGFAEDKDAADGKRRIKVPQLGIVVLGNDVEIGANSTIDRATFGMTMIGDGTKVDNLVMLAHNVQTGSDCVVVAQAGVSGSTKLGKRVILGGQAGIVGHVQLGDDVMVNAQSGVNKSLPKGAAVSGSPAVAYKDWMRQQMALRSIDEMRKKVYGLDKDK